MPLSNRAAGVLSWTGTELIVFGGNDLRELGPPVRPLSDGAVYSPEDGNWRGLSDPGFSEPPYLPHAVWTGAELVVLGTPCRNTNGDPDSDAPRCFPGGVEGRAYIPGSDTWRRIPVPEGATGDPANPQYGAVGWTGQAAVFQLGERYYAFDPRTDDWRSLPSPPIERPHHVCAEDGTVRAIRYRDRAMAPELQEDVEPFRPARPPPPDREGAGQVAELDLNRGRWRTTTVPVQQRRPLILNAFCGGASTLLLAAGNDPSSKVSHLYDSRLDRWTVATPPPAPLGAAPVGRWTESEFVVFGDGATAAFNPQTNRWRRLTVPAIGKPYALELADERFVLQEYSLESDRLKLDAYVADQ